MIIIVADSFSPRINYIVQLLFGQILQTKYKVAYIDGAKNALDELISGAGNILINYSNSHISGALKIPCCGLLTEADIQQLTTEFRLKDNLLQLYFKQKPVEPADVEFDIFSAAFYLATEYYNYTNQNFDEHGRYIENENSFFAQNHHQQPWLHIYAELLWEKLKEKNSTLVRTPVKFNYQVTFDIDAPFLYRHRPVWLQFAGFCKDILKADFEAVKTRWKVLNGKMADPYDVYDYILQKTPLQKLLFFYLLDRHSAHDERFTYKNLAYAKLIKELTKAGVAAGIHPSYTSFLNEIKIKFEKEQLEAFFGNYIYAARIHFLKYRLPNTYVNLLKNTLLHDYTACPVHKPGFKHGMAIPFQWYNLSENKSTNLTIHPTQLMDRTLQKYMNLTPEAASEEIKKIIDATAAVNGTFTILWHNSSLSEYKEWRGWRSVFEESLRYLQQISR